MAFASKYASHSCCRGPNASGLKVSAKSCASRTGGISRGRARGLEPHDEAVLSALEPVLEQVSQVGIRIRQRSGRASNLQRWTRRPAATSTPWTSPRPLCGTRAAAATRACISTVRRASAAPGTTGASAASSSVAVRRTRRRSAAAAARASASSSTHVAMDSSSVSAASTRARSPRTPKHLSSSLCAFSFVIRSSSAALHRESSRGMISRSRRMADRPSQRRLRWCGS